MSEPQGTTPDVFHFEDGRKSFEDLGQANGQRWWWWSDLQSALGYASGAGAQKAFDRAMTACNSLGVPIHENFSSTARQDTSGYTRGDFKLSRFACYLIAMNADPRKPEVAQAQAYFATLAQAAQAAQEIERVAMREDVSDGERTLASTANRAGVEQWGLFQNAGYRGLYNMNLRDLRARKGVPGTRTPLDFMGKTELAANLFRITQTEEKIRQESVFGQSALERAAETVGREVRSTMQRISGTVPENLPPAGDIRGVRKELKATSKTFKKMDGKSLPKGKSKDAASDD